MDNRVITVTYSELVNHVILPFLNRINDLKFKVKTVCDYELNKRNRSNVVLQINDELILDIKNTIDSLKTYSINENDKYIVTAINDSFNKFNDEYNKANERLDSFLGNKTGSLDNSNWNNSIENSIYELSVLILNVLDTIYSKYQLQRIKNEYESIDSIKENYDRFVEDNKKIISDIEVKLEQKLYDKDISSLQNFYEKRLLDIGKEHFWNRLFFYITFGSLIVLIVLMLLDILCFNKVFSKAELEFTKNNVIIYLLIVSLSGLLSFLMTDFRKRMNISKSILDEISQKKIIIDSYSILMEKKKTISDDNQKQYEFDLIASIFHNILSIKNNGYAHKDMQSISPNYLVELINKLLSQRN